MFIPCPRSFYAWLVAGTWCLVGDCAVAQSPEQPRPAVLQQAPRDSQLRYWTTDWAFKEIDVGRFFSRLQSIGINVPVIASGNVTVQFSVSIPLTRLRDARAYRLSGRITSKRLQVEDLLLQDFEADVVYDEGVMQVDNLRGRCYDGSSKGDSGSFFGNAKLALAPRGDIQVRLEANSIPIGPLHNLIVAATDRRGVQPLHGTITGEFNFESPLDQIRDVTAWNADAHVKVDEICIGDTLPLSVDTGPLMIRHGILVAEDLVATSSADDGIRIDLATQFELTDNRRFEFRIRGNDVPLQSLARMALSNAELADGKLDIDARGQGELRQPGLHTQTWQIDGHVGSPRLTIVGQDFGLFEHSFEFDQQSLRFEPLHRQAAMNQDAMILKSVSANYLFDHESLRITELVANVFGGRIAGDVTLAKSGSGAHAAKLKWDDLRPTFYASELLPIDMPLSARSSGSMDWSASANSVFSPTGHRGSARLLLTEIKVGNRQIGQTEFELHADQGALQVAGTGTLFGGTFQVDTKSVPTDDDSWSSLLRNAPLGQVKIESMRLDQLAPVLRPRDLRRYRGRVSATTVFHPEARHQGEAKASLQFAVHDVWIGGRPVSRQLAGTLRWVDGIVVIERASGTYADGRLWASGRWPLGGGEKQVRLRLADVNASTALLPLSAPASQRVAGKISGSLTVTGENAFRVQGEISARKSSLFSVATGTVHSSVGGSVASDLSRWEVKLSSIEGELAGGQIGGEVRIASSSALAGAIDLSSRWSVRRVDFGQLLAETGRATSMAHGRLSGTLTLGGRHVRNVSDLSGQFEADLRRTQGAAVPGLVQANRFLTVVSLAQADFSEGHIDGLIGGGSAKIDEFWLRNDRVRVWADGRIQLASGRMDIAAVIATGNFEFDDARIVSLATQLAIESALPIAALIEINRIFNDRTIYVDVTGPMTHPTTRLKPFETLRQQAGRFLIREVLIATMALNSNPGW